MGEADAPERSSAGRGEDQESADRQTASLAGVAITLLLLVVGLFLVRELHDKAMIEDCLLSGRSNCDAVLNNLPWTPAGCAARPRRPSTAPVGRDRVVETILTLFAQFPGDRRRRVIGSARSVIQRGPRDGGVRPMTHSTRGG